MSNPPDDLEAVRNITKALEPFDAETRERVIRWAREKLGLPTAEQPAPKGTAEGAQQQSPLPAKHKQDIKTFVDEKKPTSDVQFAATVAYYFKFEAPVAGRKDSISAEDLQDACRKASRDRLKNPGQTLRNAHHLGLLDRIEEGNFSINTVGENLVAITLHGGATKRPASRKKISKETATKRTPKAKGK